MQQNRVLFFKLTDLVQILICVAMIAAPVVAASMLGLSDLILIYPQALVTTALVYLGFVAVVLLIALQLKAESTRGKLTISRLVGRASVENGRLSELCVIAFRNGASKKIQFALDDIGLNLDFDTERRYIHRTNGSVVEPGQEFPFSFQHLLFAAPIQRGSGTRGHRGPAVLQGEISLECFLSVFVQPGTRISVRCKPRPGDFLRMEIPRSTSKALRSKHEAAQVGVPGEIADRPSRHRPRRS